jgi:hypothetical protein
MSRGNNYDSNQRGDHLQPKVDGKGGPIMRPDGIYRQDEPQRSSGGKNDVCIPFLAGKCTFEKGCRKRHPSKDDVPRLLARYKKTRCRFRDECYTEGCLFLHPKEERQQETSFIAPHHFPPLSNSCMSVSSTSSDSNSKQATASDSAWNKNPPIMVADVPTNIDSSRNLPRKKDPTPRQGGSSPTSEQQRVEPKELPAAWGSPNRKNVESSMVTNSPPPQQPQPQPQPPLPPSQEEYYGGPPQPTHHMMAPNMATPLIDPNTGYPMDPSFYYYDQSFYYNQQMISPYPIVAGNGIPDPHMGIPFNAEAKEFVPGMFTA